MIPAILVALLLGQAQGGDDPRAFTPRPLSLFEKAKAESLLLHRLPCLGCHELGGQGGRIGPSLSELKRARTPEYVSALILDPQAMAPGTVMPVVSMTPATRALIADYLTQREPTAGGPAPIRPRAASDSAASSGAPALYGRYCAPCHGVRGGGDGYNARFLPIRPTVHADPTYMAARPDDALFDAIHAGGYIMKRSNRMPPFGRTLTRDQIWALVRHLRTLCRCEGPGWSRDNNR